MQTKRTIGFVVLITIIVLLGCQAISDVEGPNMRPTARAMKGYELYSWQVDGMWRFALVLGTNRQKVMDELTAPDVALASLDELRTRLSQLVPGEEIIWITQRDAHLSLPPEPTIVAIKEVCQELSLNLTIMSD